MAYINPAAPALPVTAAQIAAGNVFLRVNAAMLCSVLVTTATTAAQAITFVDANTAAQVGTATVIAIIPGGTTAGTNFPQLNMPCQFGITIVQNAALAAGAITVAVG